MKMKKLKWVIGAAMALVVLAACGNEGNAGNGDETVVRVGVVGSFHAQWDTINEILAEDNIRVELVPFTDGTLINPALDSGDIDLNAFQNVGFFNHVIEYHDLDLEIIGYTFVSPMVVVAGNADIEADVNRQSLAGYIPEGSTIAIPNDVTNAGRALKVLEQAGLLTMDPAVGYLGTAADIQDNPFNLEIITVEAGSQVSLLPDVAAAVLNAPTALTGGISATYDSIFTEDAFATGIAENLHNIIVARAEEADNPIFAAIVAAYQTYAVKEVFATEFQGAFVPIW